MTAVWHLRQSDSRLASAAAADMLCEKSECDQPERALTCAWNELALGEIDVLFGRHDEAIARINRATEVFEEQNCSSGRSEAHWIGAIQASEQGDVAQRDLRMHLSLEAAIAAGDQERMDAARLSQACFDGLGDGKQALDRHHASMEAYLRSNNPGIRALAHCFLMHGLQGVGERVRSLEHGLAARQASEDAGQFRRAIWDGVVAATTMTELGDLSGAFESLQDLLTLAERVEWPSCIASCKGNLAFALLKLGRCQAALEMAEAAIDRFNSPLRSANQQFAIWVRSEAQAQLGQLDSARRGYESLLLAPSERELDSLPPYGWLGVARVAFAQSRFREAEITARRAFETGRSRGDVIVQADALRLLSKIVLAIDEPVSAAEASMRRVEMLKEALRLQPRLDPECPDSELLSELAEALEQGGNTSEALVVAKQAANASIKARAIDATRRGMAFEVRFKTERARREAELMRRVAEQEKRRSAELEAANDRLSQALRTLEDVRAQLEERNAALGAANAQIEELSQTDPLTGLRNRRYFARAAASSAAAQTSNTAFYLLDLDHFKAVNDVHGHAAGDAMLVQLKGRLASVTREQDHLVRWGGEEFLVVTQGLDRQGAVDLAERLRRSVSDIPFTLPDGATITKTVSIGFSLLVRDAAGEVSTWEQAIALADARLYVAKQNGRNRCVGIESDGHCPSPCGIQDDSRAIGSNEARI